MTDWQFKKSKGESWQENAIFCQGLDLSLEKAGQIQRRDASSHESQVEFLENNVATHQEDSDDCVSLLEQLELAASEDLNESSDEEVVNIEDGKAVAFESDVQGDHNRHSIKETSTKARAASDESTVFSTDQEDFVMVPAASPSNASLRHENPPAADDTAWPSWTGM